MMSHSQKNRFPGETVWNGSRRWNDPSGKRTGPFQFAFHIPNLLDHARS